jgi:hypothetical protein
VRRRVIAGDLARVDRIVDHVVPGGDVAGAQSGRADRQLAIA